MDVNKWAWFYHEQGFNIIPLKEKDKRPNIEKWKEWQTKDQTKEQIQKWIDEKVFQNIGIICGHISNDLVVIDIDRQGILEKLGLKIEKIKEKRHWVVRTGRGYHIYCKHNENPGDLVKDDELHIEYRANGGYVVAPPSIHPNGSEYRFLYDETPETLKEIEEEDVKKVFRDMQKRLGGKSSKKTKTIVQGIKKGVQYGSRNNSAFKLACDYRDKGNTIEETTLLLMNWNKKNRPPLHDNEIVNCIRSAYKKETLLDKDLTLEDVYKVVDKYLFVSDYNRIDLILATALSNQIPGTPIWMFIVGNSGDWKSAFTQSLEILPNCLKVDQITKNTLATGQKDAWDLGKELQNKSSILLFPDLASLTSMNTDDKNAIWGQFRNLYDGFILKSTGGGVKKAYENCHVTMVACTTQAIRDEILIHAQLGTRELMYDTNPDMVDNTLKMDKAWDNEEFEKQMKAEIQKTVFDFLNGKEIKDIEIDQETKEFLKQEAQKLSVLRASGMTDRRYKELINPIYPEIPTRLIKQFKRIYISLKSLTNNYPDEKCKKIISHIVNSSGDIVRRIVLESLYLSRENLDFAWCNIRDIQNNTRLGRNTIKRQCEMLWNLGVIDKEVREERIGGYVINNEYGNEEMRGGRVEFTSYYKFNGGGLYTKTLTNDI